MERKDEQSPNEGLLQKIHEQQAIIERMMYSKSWRLTTPLRKAGELFGYAGLLARCKALFVKNPNATWSAKEKEAKLVQQKIDRWKREKKKSGIYGTTHEVCVIIPCHNYGKYLKETIQSVLDQTLIPQEVVVVDDASTDDTKAIAESFAGRGVSYLRGDWHHVSDTRNAGAWHAKAPFLLFLDADDTLHCDYVARCLSTMRDPRIGIAYGDLWEFGESDAYHLMPEFDAVAFERDNFISSHALIRRQAYDLVGGYRRIEEAPTEDWDLYRRILETPYLAKKAKTFVRYRVHSDSLYQTFLKDPQRTHARAAALAKQPITIFTPFAGRESILDRYLDALKNLECDPENIHLHWFNTSDDPSFDERLRQEMSTLPFGKLTYARAPLPTLWKTTPHALIRNRMHSMEAGYYYEMAVVYAYNTLLKTCDTSLALTLEDDIAPEPSSLRRMLETMDNNTVAVVAPYRCQIQDYMLIWNRDAKGIVTHVAEPRTGIEEVGGSGFGCSLFRMSALRSQPIFTSLKENPPQWYDRNAFFHLAIEGKILCNWDIRVEHLRTDRFISPPESSLPRP